MDWVKFIAAEAKVSGWLRADEAAKRLHRPEAGVFLGLKRQEKRGIVEHFGKKIFINCLCGDFSGRELVNVLRPQAYVSLETVLRDSGISTQTPRKITCVTTQRAGEFSSTSLDIAFQHIAVDLYWGFQEKRTLYGGYKIAEPEKALLDWLYLRRLQGISVPGDELDLSGIDAGKLLKYSRRFPSTVQRHWNELYTAWNAGRQTAAIKAIQDAGQDEKRHHQL